jgi:geranylgeranyl reductase family protein
MKKYDVAVIGAGPIGSTISRYLAEKGFNVVILEKKKTIGVPLQCAGLIGKRIKEINLLPDEIILNEIYGAHLHSPSDISFSVSKKQPEAYVIDRMEYDKLLAKLAVDSGAELRMHHKVTAIEPETGQIHFKNNNNSSINAEIVVGADGYKSIASRTCNNPSKTFQAAQYLMKVEKNIFNPEFVHVYVDHKISPGFIWIIPLPDQMVRLGLFSNLNYHEMNILLKNFINNNPYFINSSVLKKYHGHIPVYEANKKILNHRVLLLGDAASQVKPTSGGGLNLGFTCAQLASDVITNALENQNLSLLNDYPENYNKLNKKELRMQLKVHKIFSTLKNSDLDYMFQQLINEGAPDIISKYGDLDSQSELVKEMLKRGILLSILPKLFSRRITALWK